MLLRMLHDRKARIEREAQLREKIAQLEAELGRHAEAEHAGWSAAESFRSRPR
jgi:hypothetical protein